MKRVKLTVAYDGTRYSGWQVQQNAVTIEGVLNKALSKLTGEEIAVIGASRTDAGVHAMGNVAVFDTESTIPGERFLYVLNQKMPEDIVIVASEEVPLTWHPRHQDTLKTYEYRILNAKLPDPTRRLYTNFVSFDLDIDLMRKGAAYLVGEHDFAGFCSVKTNAKTTVRTITDLQVLQKGDEIIIRVTGNGFLYNMVRIIVGTLVDIGRGRIKHNMEEIINSKSRSMCGHTAPAHGLFLKKVNY